MGNKIPKVTVLMPVYNGENYLGEAINSILNQSFREFEFLIIDDGSTDETNNIIASFKDRRIRIIENNGNIGLIASLNKGIDLAKGEFIARMDADDISLPDRLEKQIDFMNNHTDVGVLGTGFQIIDSNGIKYGLPLSFPTNHDFLQWSMYFYSPIVHPSVMMNKVIIREIGGYSSLYVHAEDYDLWIRASEVTKTSNLEDNLLLLRKYGDNITETYLGEHKQNAIKICHSMISDRLHKDIPNKVIEDLWETKCLSVKDALEVCQLIYMLYRNHARKDNLARNENKLIRDDAGNRLFHILRPFVKDVHTWNYFLLSFFLNPNILLEHAKKLSGNLFAKSI
ncbi:glycosyltransferase [Thermodesulfobacteriota bacterium]